MTAAGAWGRSPAFDQRVHDLHRRSIPAVLHHDRRLLPAASLRQLDDDENDFEKPLDANFLLLTPCAPHGAFCLNGQALSSCPPC